MAQQDLSYVFQPVIHEPLSRPDVSSLTECSLQSPVAEHMQDSEFDGSTAVPLSPSSAIEEERDAIANIEEADKCKNDHPRKAMSLYLKAGKALVLCNQADAALKCFRSLIHLATDQLSKVVHEKQKLTKLRRSGTSVEDIDKKDKKKVSRAKSFDIPKRPEAKTPRLSPRNCNSVSENAEETQEENQCEVVEQTVAIVQEPAQEVNHCEFIAVEEIQSTQENVEGEVVVNCDNQEMFVSEEVCVCEPVTEIGCQDDVPVFSVTEVKDIGGAEEMTMSCETTDLNVCEVNCFETEASLEFEVAMVDSLDDSASTHSSVSTEDIVKTVNAEIVMVECNEVIMSAEEVPANPQQNAFIRRGYVVSELIDTEQNYIRDLNDVIKGYMAALSKEFNVPSEIKGKEKVIFSNIEDIHKWHSSTFFEKLKLCEDDPSKLGEVFTSSETKLEELYTIYCRSKPKSDLHVLPHKDTFFKECRKRCGHRLQLPDYLIKPVQRITKYQLLLRDILKFTERAGEDGSAIQHAIDVALRILKRTNDMIAVAMIQGYDAKPDETGELLLRETLEIAEGKYRQKVKERAVFLFERMMVITDPVEKEGGVTELRYQNSIKTHGLGITETVDSDPCKWAIWLRKRGSSEIYVLKAPTTQIKETWMKSIKECSLKKKAPGLLKSLYRSKTFKREESETKEILDSLSPTMDYVDSPLGKQSSGRKSSKRKPSKVISRKKKSRESGISDRLKENILKFRAEEQMINVEEVAEVTYDEPPNSLSTLSPDSALPQSPEPIDTTVSFIEQRAKIEAEENQLNKVLMLTRLIAARILQTKDASESLSFYCDVIGSVLPINDLRRHQETIAARDNLLERCAEVYENWRRENLFESSDIEDRYTSMTSLLSETAGFCSVHKGRPWSVVLYSLCAMAGGREQKWRDASQAFYRLSLIYSALQETNCAVDSLVDAHWMSCQAGDYQGAINFFYNAFIRALACRDLMRCLRFEQQGMFLMERMTLKDGNNNCNTEVNDDNESRGLVSPQHLTFLINMSRATRRKDWAWFEFAESELALIARNNTGRQADAILSAVYQKLKRFIGETITS